MKDLSTGKNVRKFYRDLAAEILDDFIKFVGKLD
jgi:hypothetical protein